MKQAMENMAMEKGYQHWPADIQVIMGVMIMVVIMMVIMLMVVMVMRGLMMRT